ncbi:hypothetical protein KBB25_02200 [Candidatus Gracilibacteria bacterium]|nr:hypothetical protein [Candidatus Gracilibacteria bacterium]
MFHSDFISHKFLWITGIFTCIGVIVEYLTSGFLNSLVGFLQVIIFALFLSSLRFLLSKKIPLRFLFFRFVLIFGAITGFFSAILVLFSLYYNSFPSAVGKIILSDGNRTVVFFQMSHIATPRFYEQIKNELTTLSHSGYTIYAEGVRPGTPENTEKFQKFLGVRLTENTYEKIAQMIGMDAQSKTIFDSVASGSLKNVDISIDEIVALMGTGSKLQSTDVPLDIESEIAKIPYTEMKPLTQYIIRAVLNMVLSKNEYIDDILNGSMNPELFDIILGKRNEHIVNTFLSTDNKHTVFVYGSLHFSGIYKLLSDNNKNWKIISVTPIYPYKP